MSEYNITKISADNDIFNSQNYVDDKLLFNYIEGARVMLDTELYSDENHVIICRKKDHKNVWIWSDNDSCDNVELVIEIAKTISSFNIVKPEFFTKPNLAQIFSDMYALVSSDLDYHIKDEFSLGAYKYTGASLQSPEDTAVVLYKKDHYNALLNFYNELSKEFSWEQGKAEYLCKQCENMTTYLLIKNNEVMSLCSVCEKDNDCSFISSIATKKSDRNNGFGSYVTNFAANATTQNGDTLMVYTNKGNLSSASAFTKAGFTLIGDIHLIKS